MSARVAVQAVQRLPDRVADAALAAAVALVAVVEVLRSDVDAPLAAQLAAAVAIAATLAWRRSAVVGAAVGWTVLAVAQVAFVVGLEQSSAPFLSFVLLAYAAGRHAALRPARVALGVLVAGIVGVYVLGESDVVGDFIFPPLIAIAVWLGGRAVRQRHALGVELQEADMLAREAREREAAAAEGEERRRIAREMHDVVAHSVSVMVVQAGGARRILERDPDRAAEAAARIERTGREALAEMRRLLGVIGADPDAALGPQPSLARLEELVARSRAAGLEVTLREQGEPRPLPAGLELAAFRVVQEGLTNALKHAGPSEAEVVLRWEDGCLEVEVVDEGAAGAPPALVSGGHGLVGMQERVRLYDGELDAGPLPGGGFRVHARFPIAQEVAR